jgi:2-polyprenyl-3-methyl-5-hydroxy-6-metoxy-1,4-benzoquinol methylase
MRHTIIMLMCALLMAQDPVPAHIQEFAQWRLANPGSRSWDDDLRLYRAKLIASNVTEKDADAIILELRNNRDLVGAARWNASLLDPGYRMSHAPNRLLMETIKGRKPGTALDIGMGEGRNSIYLAQLGWSVTGFDQAEKAVNAARQRAAEAKLPLQTVVARFDRFDFTREHWDLVVDMYEFVPVRRFRQQVYESLKPGGLWVIEGFGSRSEAPANAMGEGSYGSGELLRLLANQFRILKYEEVEDVADFGLQVSPLVRVVAQKK